MRTFTASFIAITVSLFPMSSALAEDFYTMDDISASLQMEYQGQLVLQPQSKPAVKARKVIKKPRVEKRAPVRQPVRQQQPRAQQRAIPPAPPVAARAPVPHAEDLFEAATYGNVNLITRLIQQGVNINSANSERETALHMAAANGRYPAVIYLLNHGANIHARTIKNWTPIHHAARFRKTDIANYLMRKGASAHARTSDGLSAIDMARTLKDQQLLRVLGAQ